MYCIHSSDQRRVDLRPHLIRQRRSFVERGLDVSLLSSAKLVLIEANLRVKSWGIGLVLQKEVRPALHERSWYLTFSQILILWSVTGIIHNGAHLCYNYVEGLVHRIAWRVDFNLKLSSFGDSLLAVRNLFEFALSSYSAKPPRIVFASSVSVLRSKFETLCNRRGAHR
jgi:hypothetical protein